MNIFSKASLVAGFLSLSVGFTHAAEQFKHEHAMFKEKSVKQDDGSEKTVLEKVKSVLPGEELVGVMKYEYTHAVQADNVVFSLPVRKEFAYVEGSATDEKYVWFSTDNGKTFQRMKDLIVKMPSGAERPATGNDVTNLEWRMARPIQKGEKGELSYRIIVR